MSEQAWTFPRPTTWPAGPWDGEPDKVQWVDEATDLDCLIVRGPSGALCGYVGVPPGHRFYRRQYHQLPQRVHRVHGTLTFSDHCQIGVHERGVCHIPAPGRPAEVWWLGFDCCHCGDLAPRELASDLSLREFFSDAPSATGTYRDISYVRAEVRRLALLIAPKPICPPCTHDCNQGRSCPARRAA